MTREIYPSQERKTDRQRRAETRRDARKYYALLKRERERERCAGGHIRRAITAPLSYIALSFYLSLWISFVYTLYNTASAAGNISRSRLCIAAPYTMLSRLVFPLFPIRAENNGFSFDRRRAPPPLRCGRLNWKYAIRQCVKSSSFPLSAHYIALFFRPAAAGCFIRHNPTIFRGFRRRGFEIRSCSSSSLNPIRAAVAACCVCGCTTQPVYAFNVPIYATLL